MTDRARRTHVCVRSTPPATWSTTWSIPDDQRWHLFEKALAPVFDSEPSPDAPRLHAVANAHIDTGWLWRSGKPSARSPAPSATFSR